MFKISVKGNFKNLEKTFKKKNVDMPNFIEKIAQEANASIQRRVQNKGLDVKTRSMPRYTKPYEAFKRRRGRQVSFRDLTFSGKMWQSLTTQKVGGNKVKMFFMGNFAKIAEGNQNIRIFFGISQMEAEVIETGINEFLKDL